MKEIAHPHVYQPAIHGWLYYERRITSVCSCCPARCTFTSASVHLVRLLLLSTSTFFSTSTFIFPQLPTTNSLFAFPSIPRPVAFPGSRGSHFSPGPISPTSTDWLSFQPHGSSNLPTTYPFTGHTNPRSINPESTELLHIILTSPCSLPVLYLSRNPKGYNRPLPQHLHRY